MKGVSPLVAAVLLIAATMTIAGIIAFWTSGFVKSRLEQQENKTTEMLCQGIEIEFYNEPTLDERPTGNLSFIIHYKYGTQPVNLEKVLIFYGGEIIARNLTNKVVGPKNPYEPVTVSNVKENYTEVKVTTNCPGVEAGWP